MKHRFIVIAFILCAAELASAHNLLLQDSLKIISPNGGEKYYSGSDTVITWKGIPLTDTVRLEYSSDYGITWNVISDVATGGVYPWHLPKTVSNGYMVRVEHIIVTDTNGWIRNARGNGRDAGQAVATDKLGNIYLAGSFQGNLNFGTMSLNSSGKADIFVAKYSPDGNVIWAKRAGGIGDSNVCNGIAVDNIGNIYLTGLFEGTAEFGNFTITSVGSQDIFVSKYQSDGTVEWVNRAGGKDGDDAGRSITVDSSNNVYITGYFRGSNADFGKDILKGANAYPDFTDIFITKYLSDGTELWAKSAGGSNNDYGSGITSDINDNIFVTGYFEGPAKFGTISTNSSNIQVAFVAKYLSNGEVVWVKEAGGPDNQSASFGLGISTDSIGNIYFTGGFMGIINFGGIQMTSPFIYETDIFVAKYNAKGLCEWAQKAGGSNDESNIGWAITSDALGNTFVTGKFFGDQSYPANFGGVRITSSFGSGDIFVVKYLHDGTLDWVKDAGGFNEDCGNGITLDSKGNIILTGYYSYTASFDFEQLVSSRDSNVFIWKFGNQAPAMSVVSGFFSISTPINSVKPDKQGTTVHINPNPSKGIIHIEIQTTETGRTQLFLMNLLGQKISTIFDGELQIGSHSFDLKTSDLPSGSYFVVMTTPSVRRIERIDVAK